MSAALTVLLLACAWYAPAGAQDNKCTIALVGGQLLDGYNAEPIHDPVILIEGKTITAAGPSHSVDNPETAHVIDTRGKTVMPRLSDLHVHMEIIGHGDNDEFEAFIDGDRDKLRIAREIEAKQSLRAGAPRSSISAPA